MMAVVTSCGTAVVKADPVKMFLAGWANGRLVAPQLCDDQLVVSLYVGRYLFHCLMWAWLTCRLAGLRLQVLG
jgi:hypothetical protein